MRSSKLPGCGLPQIHREELSGARKGDRKSGKATLSSWSFHLIIDSLRQGTLGEYRKDIPTDTKPCRKNAAPRPLIDGS